MERLYNYSIIVIIVIILAYFFKNVVYKSVDVLKNLVNLSTPTMNFLYI